MANNISDNSSLKQKLSDFVLKYESERKKKFSSDLEIYKCVVKEIPYIINKNIAISNDFIIMGSVGRGNWATVPWIAILNKNITTSAQYGVYIVYLLSEDRKRLYLTLAQGSTEFNDNIKTKPKTELLKEVVDSIRNGIKTDYFSNDTSNIKIGSSNHSKDYQDGAIYYKEYDCKKIPNDEILKSDLEKILDIYNRYAANPKNYPVNYKFPEGSKFKNDTMSPTTEDSSVDITQNSSLKSNKIEYSRNRIIFGAPGTGKSHKLKVEIESIYDNKDDIIEYTERVTFHPDYSYANFVGTYKPAPDDNNKDLITYKYVPGPFMRIYSKAKKDPEHTYILVIEEINRAMVSGVFGDIFQLLDRDSNGESEFPVNTSKDAEDYLKEDGLEKPEILSLPSNLYIWATMNSADQGVFPMDTAFKRRWDFEYLDIDFGEKTDIVIKKELKDGLQEFNWNNLRKKINEYLINSEVNEDKLMGPFFISPNSIRTNKVIDVDKFWSVFKNKVIMYLYEDAGKQIRPKLFGGAKSKVYTTYSQICNYFDEVGIKIFNNVIVEDILNKSNSGDNE